MNGYVLEFRGQEAPTQKELKETVTNVSKDKRTATDELEKSMSRLGSTRARVMRWGESYDLKISGSGMGFGGWDVWFEYDTVHEAANGMIEAEKDFADEFGHGLLILKILSFGQKKREIANA